MSKLSALFGIPTTLVGVLATTSVIGSVLAGALITLIGSVQLAVWAYLSPNVPWVGERPPGT